MEGFIYNLGRVPRDYEEITLFRQWEEEALAAEEKQYLPAAEYPDILLRLYDTYTYDYIIRID